ncbi:hypothetical protein WH47_06006, partial [Habropoda laboriosa]
PPRLCDLTSLDYFRWDYLKSKVYTISLQIMCKLKDDIWHVIHEIEQQLRLNTIENFERTTVTIWTILFFTYNCNKTKFISKQRN